MMLRGSIAPVSGAELASSPVSSQAASPKTF